MQYAMKIHPGPLVYDLFSRKIASLDFERPSDSWTSMSLDALFQLSASSPARLCVLISLRRRCLPSVLVILRLRKRWLVFADDCTSAGSKRSPYSLSELHSSRKLYTSLSKQKNI